MKAQNLALFPLEGRSCTLLDQPSVAWRHLVITTKGGPVGYGESKRWAAGEKRDNKKERGERDNKAQRRGGAEVRSAAQLESITR